MHQGEPVALLRIYIGESDRWKGKPLYEAIMLTARESGMAGCTVMRAVAGFGANSRIRTARVLRLSMDLPIVVELVDLTAKLETFVGQIEEMIIDGLVIIEPVDVRIYRSGK
jgi:PII-like signaling protein